MNVLQGTGLKDPLEIVRYVDRSLHPTALSLRCRSAPDVSHPHVRWRDVANHVYEIVPNELVSTALTISSPHCSR